MCAMLSYVSTHSCETTKVIGGAGGNCTKKVVAATQKCKDLGCTAVLSVIPYYNKPTQGGLIAHFTVSLA